MNRMLSIVTIAVLACGFSAAQTPANQSDANTATQQTTPAQRASDTAGTTGLSGDNHNGHAVDKSTGMAVVGKKTIKTQDGTKASVVAEQGPGVKQPQTANSNNPQNASSNGAAANPQGNNANPNANNANANGADKGDLGANNDLSANNGQGTDRVAQHTTSYWWWILIAAVIVVLLIARWIAAGRKADQAGVPDIRSTNAKNNDRFRKVG